LTSPIGFICGSASPHTLTVYTNETLELDESLLEDCANSTDPDAGDVSSSNSKVVSQDNDVYEEEKRNISIRYKKRAVDFWRNEKGKKQLSFKTVQHRFNLLKQPSELYRWEKQIEQEGARHDKAQYVENEVLKFFKQNRDGNKPVHDYNLKRWVLDAARRVNYISFRASQKWLHYFKKTQHYVQKSYKICNKAPVRRK